MWPQQSSGHICQVWMWYSKGNKCFKWLCKNYEITEYRNSIGWYNLDCKVRCFPPVFPGYYDFYHLSVPSCPHPWTNSLAMADTILTAKLDVFLQFSQAIMISIIFRFLVAPTPGPTLWQWLLWCQWHQRSCRVTPEVVVGNLSTRGIEVNDSFSHWYNPCKGEPSEAINYHVQMSPMIK